MSLDYGMASKTICVYLNIMYHMTELKINYCQISISGSVTFYRGNILGLPYFRIII